jgi:hypothetical protein
MSSKVTKKPTKKVLEVFEMMKDGKEIKVDTLISRLEVKPVTVMVLICALRNDFGGVIETVRDGKKAFAYKLTNAKELAPRMVLDKNTTAKATKTKAKTKAKAKKAVATKKVAAVSVSKTKKPVKQVAPATTEAYQVEEVSGDELASLRAELGLNDSAYSE